MKTLKRLILTSTKKKKEANVIRKNFIKDFETTFSFNPISTDPSRMDSKYGQRSIFMPEELNPLIVNCPDYMENQNRYLR